MSSAQLNGADARIIQALITSQDDCWASGDAVGYSRAVQEDCVFTNIFGQVFLGRDAFQAQHQAIFASIYKGTRLLQTVNHLRFLRPDVAAVDTSVEVTAPGREPLHTKLFQLFVKSGASWGIAAYHNVAVQRAPGD
jgi:uncharacterized protein (TIGR02246 family)